MITKDYFKGWYFKCTDEDKTIAFIPAYHQSGGMGSASLQIITDDEVYNVPIGSFECREKSLYIKAGNCLFTNNGIELDIKSEPLTMKGSLRFQELSPIKYDIMGPFALIPFMQCRHTVCSMRHGVDGEVIVNGTRYSFSDGIGYIEGDSGISFPRRYIWTQSAFDNGSLMLSVADIPLLGMSFTGIIGVVMLDGKEYRVATYLGAKIKHIGDNTVTVKQGDYQLTAKLIKKKAHPLRAPVCGSMSRTIHESAACKAYYRFSHRDDVICEFVSDRASFEFEYASQRLV